MNEVIEIKKAGVSWMHIVLADSDGLEVPELFTKTGMVTVRGNKVIVMGGSTINLMTAGNLMGILLSHWNSDRNNYQSVTIWVPNSRIKQVSY